MKTQTKRIIQIFVFFILIFLCVSIGWFVGVRAGGVAVAPPVYSDTLKVDTLIYEVTKYEEKLDTIYLSDDSTIDSLSSVVGTYLDSIYKLVDIVASYDTTTSDYELAVKYYLSRNMFDVSVKLNKPTVNHYISEAPHWLTQFSLYVDSEVNVGFGYSALAFAYNLNEKTYKIIFNPRISDIMSWIK